MKTSNRTALSDPSLWVLKKALSYGTILVAGLVAALLLQLSEKYKFKPARIAGVIVFLGGLLAAFVTVPEVINRMKQTPTMYLSEAIRHTFYSYIMMAAFLPVIGPFIGRALEPKKTNPFIDDGGSPRE